MNQKRSKWKENKELEVVLRLLNGDCHPRQLSKELKIPLSSLLRVLKSLQEKNIIDYNVHGKNKSYYLKDNLEMLNLVKMAELYKLDKFIFCYPKVGMILEKIVRQAKVRLILLFGSYAKFSAKEDSDIDIYLATKNSKIKRELFDIDNKISVETGNFNRKSHLGKEIIKHHIILKGLEEFYEKNKIFN